MQVHTKAVPALHVLTIRNPRYACVNSGAAQTHVIRSPWRLPHGTNSRRPPEVHPLVRQAPIPPPTYISSTAPRLLQTSYLFVPSSPTAWLQLLTKFLDLVGVSKLKHLDDQSGSPALHSAEWSWFESPSGASPAQFLLVRYPFFFSLGCALVRGARKSISEGVCATGWLGLWFRVLLCGVGG